MNMAKPVQDTGLMNISKRSLQSSRLDCVMSVSKGKSAPDSGLRDMFSQVMERCADPRGARAVMSDRENRSEKKDISRALYAVLGSQCERKLCDGIEDNGTDHDFNPYEILVFDEADCEQCPQDSLKAQYSDVSSLISVMTSHLEDDAGTMLEEISGSTLVRHLNEILKELLLSEHSTSSALMQTNGGSLRDIGAVYVLILNLILKEKPPRTEIKEAKQSFKDRKKQVLKRIAQNEAEEKENMAQFAMSFMF